MRPLLFALVTLSLLAAQARAGDVVLGGKTEVWFDDNVYGTSSAEVSDFTLDIAPTLKVSERWETLEGSLFLKPTYELFIDEQNLRGFNYDANGTLEWTPSARTTISLSDTFARYRSLRGFGGQQAVLAGRDPYTRNVVQLAASHRTSPRGTLQLSASHGLFGFSRQTRPDQQSSMGALQYSHMISERTRLGGLASFSRQAFEFANGSESHTDYYNASFTLNFVPAETFVFRASAGPTFVQQPAQAIAPLSFLRANLIRRDGAGGPLVGIVGSCPLLPSGEPFDGPGCLFVAFPFPNFLRLLDPIPQIGALPVADRGSWTYFADIALEKEWENTSVEFAYQRDQGSSSAIGYSTVSDTVRLQTRYEFLRTLSITVSLSWENREQSQQLVGLSRALIVLGTLPGTGTLPAVNNLVPVGITASPFKVPPETVQSFSASVGGLYQLSERTNLSATIAWTDQNATIGSGFGDMGRVYCVLGLNFEFEPLRW